MQTGRRVITTLSLCTLLGAAALSGEPPPPRWRAMTQKQREEMTARKLEMLKLQCRVKLAEREKTVTPAELHLRKAELSHDWFARRAHGKQSQQDFRVFEKYRVRSATLLVNAFRQTAEKAARAGLPETAENLRKRREKYLKAIRGSKWVRKEFEGKLWLAEQFLARGNWAEALKDYDALFAKFDPEGDGIGTPDNGLPSFKKLKATVRRTRGLRLADFAEARGALDEIGLCLRGRAGERKGRLTIRHAVDRDYPRGQELIDAFLKQYPEYDLDVKGKPGAQRKGLLAIRKEMDLRHKLFSAHCGAVSAAGELAKATAPKGHKALAAKLFARGLGWANMALQYRPNDTDLLLGRAKCLLGIGEVTTARRTYRQLRRGSRDGGDVWWAATRGLFTALEAEGDLKGARVVLVMAIQGYPRQIGEKWPAARTHAARLAAAMKMTCAQFMGD